jgi:hypothetical protein
MVLVPVLVAAAPLFPAPLHITRQVEDPISGKTVVLNEYAYGNRLVSVRGGKTSIADYEKGELIEIDREAATYSITRFDELARATQIIQGESNAVGAGALSDARKPASRPLRSLGARLTTNGRAADFFEGELETQMGKQRIEVGVDRTVLVSREALEVLLGAAYPGVRNQQHEVVFAAAASNRRASGSIDTTSASGGDAMFALPIEQVIRHDIDGRQLEFRTSVTRVGNEPPAPEIIAIPAGARLVVSRVVAVQRQLEQLNDPASVVPRRP